MFNQSAAKPDHTNLQMSARVSIATRKFAKAFVAAMPIVLVSLALMPETANAAPLSPTQCWRQLNTCNANCDRYPAGMFSTSCYNRCASQYKKCLNTWGVLEDTGPNPRPPRPTDNSTPTGGGAKPDPKKPPKPRNDAPPTGGTKADPKPPRADSPRAPMGGGVFQPNPKTPSTGGPIILRSSGTGQPTTKPGGSSGASTRSGGRN